MANFGYCTDCEEQTRIGPDGRGSCGHGRVIRLPDMVPRAQVNAMVAIAKAKGTEMSDFTKWNPGMWVSSSVVFTILGAGDHAQWVQRAGWVGLACIAFMALYATFHRKTDNG